MKNLFQKETVDEILNRINKLTPATQRQWGKMNVDQMLAHCSVGLQTATGEKVLNFGFFLKMIGSLLKSQTTSPNPFPKNGPTHPAFKIEITEGFEIEKVKLITLINQFNQGGESKCTSNHHSFYGKLTPTQWSSLMYKHLNHHLTQFGV